MRLRSMTGMVALLLAGCASVAPRPQPAATPTLFAFHSSPWINLHHYLLAEARPKAKPDPEPAWTDPEKLAWDAAQSYYREHFARSSPLFDGDLVAVRDELAELDSEASSVALGGLHLDAELARVLAAAAPLYRAHFWPAHDAANRQAIGRLTALVAQHPALAGRLTAWLDTPWPTTPMRVDVVLDADWAGAYTTVQPTHITIAASDPRQTGDTFLEALFHEAGHGLIRKVSATLDAELERQAVRLPRRDLWHALLFDTVGELLRRELGPDYVPYAVQRGLYQGAWGDYRGAIERHWHPYLNGEIGFAAALEQLVGEIGRLRMHAQPFTGHPPRLTTRGDPPMHVTADPAILYFGTPVVLVSTTNEDGSANLAPMSSAWWLGWNCVLGFGARSHTLASSPSPPTTRSAPASSWRSRSRCSASTSTSRSCAPAPPTESIPIAGVLS
jgi:hypothetical protein